MKRISLENTIRIALVLLYDYCVPGDRILHVCSRIVPNIDVDRNEEAPGAGKSLYLDSLGLAPEEARCVEKYMTDRVALSNWPRFTAHTHLTRDFFLDEIDDEKESP